VRDIALLIGELMGGKLDVEIEQARVRPDNSEVQRLCADTSKAKRLIAWEPRFAGREGLSRGLKETIQWFTSPENLRFYKADIYNT